MRYIGIDLHRRFMVVAVVDERGRSRKPRRFECHDEAAVLEFFERHRPFVAVIEASSSYRWLYDLLSPLGQVKLAHPARLRAIVAGRAKTDKLDAVLLGQLLRAGLVPEAYVPPKPYLELRSLTRARARLVRRRVQARNEIHALLRQRNVHPPFANLICRKGRSWLQGLPLELLGGLLRDELLRRVGHFDEEIHLLDRELARLGEAFPEKEVLLAVPGIGLFSALLIIGEIGEPERFRDGRKVGAYAGLTARVSQSGDHCYHGHITRQGSPWLRWILVEAAMRAARKDEKLRNFYTRIRKRASAKIARVAVARKLAGICWIRLRGWHRDRAA